MPGCSLPVPRASWAAARSLEGKHLRQRPNALQRPARRLPRRNSDIPGRHLPLLFLNHNPSQEIYFALCPNAYIYKLKKIQINPTLQRKERKEQNRPAKSCAGLTPVNLTTQFKKLEMCMVRRYSDLLGIFLYYNNND